MPAGLDSADRKLLIAVGIISVLLIAGTAAIAPARGEGSSVPSSYSSDSGGALAAYLLLTDLHYDIHRVEDASATLGNLGRGAVLILAEPTELPSDQERHWISDFAKNGGRILFCGPLLNSFFSDANVAPNFKPGWVESTAQIPSYFSNGAHTIVLEPKAEWPTLGSTELGLYGNLGSGATVVARRIGAGELLWWASATPLTNAGIRRAGNLRLFLNAVSSPASEEPLTVYWDEYFHGQRASLWSYVQRTPIAWGLAQVGLIILAMLFSFSRRSGPVVMPMTASRLSPLEFVDTLGGLYQIAGAAPIAVSVEYNRFRLHLTRRLALPQSVGNRALAEAAAGRLGWDANRLADCLASAAASEDLQKLRPAEALDLVQKLQGYLAQLGVRKLSTPEKF